MISFILVLPALLACGDKQDQDSGGDSGDGDGGTVQTWTILGQDMDSALLSIAGTGPDDMWMVGGDVGSGPMVVHHSGGAWSRVDTGTTDDLWWVWHDGSDPWIVGAGGRVLRRNGDSFDQVVLDPDVTLFGIWGSGPTDVWTVGGNINLASDGAAMWHFDGQDWTAVDLPAEVASQVAVYKVWGRSATQVWAVGTGGSSMTWDGKTWTSVATGTDRNLFTVHGSSSEVYAVGGAFSGTILRYDDGAWVDETPDAAPQFNGVYVREGCPPVAVGTQGGAVYWRIDGTWQADARVAATTLDYHAAWLSGDCDALAAGGSISSLPLDQGVVVWGGEETAFGTMEGL